MNETENLKPAESIPPVEPIIPPEPSADAPAPDVPAAAVKPRKHARKHAPRKHVKPGKPAGVPVPGACTLRALFTFLRAHCPDFVRAENRRGRGGAWQWLSRTVRVLDLDRFAGNHATAWLPSAILSALDVPTASAWCDATLASPPDSDRSRERDLSMTALRIGQQPETLPSHARNVRGVAYVLSTPGNLPDAVLDMVPPVACYHPGAADVLTGLARLSPPTPAAS